MAQWFEEALDVAAGRAVRIQYNEHRETVQSRFQKISVYDTVPFGRMLVHDDVIMLTEADEAHYHEMIVHVAMNVHPAVRRVLVVGGGDGGTVREVLRHETVERVDLCEIDDQVVEVCRRHFPAMAGSFADPRVRLFFEDGAAFIERHPDEYDLIVVDSSDPIGPAEVLFRRRFYESLAAALRPDGIAVTQSESMHYHGPIIRELARFCREIFPVYGYYYALVPTYPSGTIGFSFCSRKYHPVRDLDRRKAGRLEGLKYYTPEIHCAAFVLPRFVCEQTGAALSI